MADGGLTQEEIDALLAGTGLDDIEDDEEDEIIEESPKASTAAPIIKKEKESKQVNPENIVNSLDRFENQNLGLLLDVKVTLTVELGRAKLPIKEILSLTDGSIIELQKLSGEQVEIMVNNVLIAKGMVIVIDENYGVQITEIIDPIERFKSLL